MSGDIWETLDNTHEDISGPAPDGDISGVRNADLADLENIVSLVLLGEKTVGETLSLAGDKIGDKIWGQLPKPNFTLTSPKPTQPNLTQPN